MKKIFKFFTRAKKFILVEIWDLDFSALTFLKRVSFGFVKVCYIVIRGFSRDKCTLHASALTYITLMSMVPLIAMMFSVAKGFGAGKRLQDVVANQTSQLPENIQEFFNKMIGYVENTNFGVLGAVGVALLFYTVIVMMGKIERSFNVIWGIHAERTFYRKFSDYISVLLVVPVMMLAATSINASLSSNAFILFLQNKVPYFAQVYQMAAGFTGTLFVWFAFSFVFAFMPNTRVRFSSALLGGIVAGTLWQWLQWAYIHLQIGVSKYNAIYGTFATIPIFLAWLYLCWLIVLFGCEVCFAYQNVRTYEEESPSLLANQSTREALAVSIMTHLVRNFELGKGPWDAALFSQEHQVPVRLVRDVVHQLTQAKMILMTDGGGSQLMPALPPENIKVKDLFSAMRGVPAGKITSKIEMPEYNGETTLKELALRKGGQKND